MFDAFTDQAVLDDKIKVIYYGLNANNKNAQCSTGKSQFKFLPKTIFK